MTKYVKEIWIQFADMETYSENEEKLFELLDKAHGECEVRVYLRSTNEHTSLYEHYFDDARLPLLVDAYGAENVKLVTKPVKARSPQDFKECCGDCIERITAALERIAAALDGEKPDGNK